MARSFDSLSFAAVLLLFYGCQQPRTIPVPDCGAQPFGVAGVEFAAASVLQPLLEPHRSERVVVHVREGTIERHPIKDASVAVLIGGGGPDSGQLARGGITTADGGVTLDSLSPRRYELLVRRIGYDPFRQRMTVRAGFVDTLTISLQGAPVCLVE